MQQSAYSCRRRYVYLEAELSAVLSALTSLELGGSEDEVPDPGVQVSLSPVAGAADSAQTGISIWPALGNWALQHVEHRRHSAVSLVFM